MKVLFLTLYPDNAPSSRFRIYQYRPYLESQGIKCTILPVLPKRMFLKLSNKKSIFLRMAFHGTEIINRFKDILRGSSYDLVVLQKGIVSLNLVGLEKLLFQFNKKVIFDFDDAVFGLTQQLPGFLRFLQDAEQIEKIIRNSKMVLAGNKFLSEFALQFNRRVSIIPTPIDTDEYLPIKFRETSGEIVIGWSGSMSTNFYVNNLISILNKLSSSFRIRLRIISNNLFGIELDKMSKQIAVEFVTWNRGTEVEDLGKIDIGTMPLNDDVWSRGKCGLKALQFMALGIPVICSPVGVNSEIIKDRENGFLAFRDNEWEEKLRELIENNSLRKQMGIAARRTVEDNYSLKVNAPKLKKTLEEVYLD